LIDDIKQKLNFDCCMAAIAYLIWWDLYGSYLWSKWKFRTGKFFMK